MSRFSGAKRPQSFRDYFDDDDDDEQADMKAVSLSGTANDDIDPLDAFMADVHQTVKKEESNIGQIRDLPQIVSYTDDYEDYEEYTNHDHELSADLVHEKDMDDVDYDSDGIPINGSNRKPLEKSVIEPLPPVDHNLISYPKFRKNFYKECLDIAYLSASQVADLRDENEISVMGDNILKPIQKFEQVGFEPKLLKEIIRIGFVTPTAIQSQALPFALSGRDIIGLAKTGSGKTLAFVWPMIMHILDQPPMRTGDGPIALILAPTRELASQIFTEAKKFCKIYEIVVCAIFGGAGKWEMTKALRESPEVVVATPGRLIELVKSKATNLLRTTYVVLDEADRMFEMGFEYQMRSIVNNIRPDRQTLLFSATMKKKVEGFARDILRDPVRIVIGTIGQANPDITQIAEVLRNEEEKLQWILTRIDEFVAEGKVLIFVLSKNGTEELTNTLRSYFIQRQLDIGVECLHGDKDQSDRMNVVRKFSKTDGVSVLVATDIAARGLDIKDIRTVINYDIAKNIETYVHRIGRTGRLGVDGIVPGTAYTLLTLQDSSFAVDLVQNLRLSNQVVSSGLERLAQTDPKWGRIKHFQGKGKSAVGGLGSTTSISGPAMTSEMMANQTKAASTINPYMKFSKAMGGSIGKPADDISKYGPGGGDLDVSPLNSVPIPILPMTQKVEAHRSISNNNTHSSAMTHSNNTPMMQTTGVSGPVLKGFVRSSQAYSSVTTNDQCPPSYHSNSNSVMTSTTSQNVPRKKSRWDT